MQNGDDLVAVFGNFKRNWASGRGASTVSRTMPDDAMCQCCDGAVCMKARETQVVRFGGTSLKFMETQARQSE